MPLQVEPPDRKMPHRRFTFPLETRIGLSAAADLEKLVAATLNLEKWNSLAQDLVSAEVPIVL
jgi:hypothetical protein